MGGRISRGGTHSIAVSSSRGSQVGDDSHNCWSSSDGGRSKGLKRGGEGSNWIGAVGRGMGGTAHPRPENVASAGLHHVRVRVGEEMERGGGGGGGGALQKLETRM